MDSIKGKKVLVSGASIAGLSAAWWMNQLGYQVTVVEMAPEPRVNGAAVDLKGDTIAVVGLGAIGLLVTHLAQRMGYRVLAYDRVPEKVNLASTFGAISIAADTTAAQMATIWKDARVHTVFECAGAAPAFTLAVEAAPRGAHVVVAGLSDKPSAITEFGMTRQGINILTSIIYQHPTDFRRTINLIESGFLQPGRIISAKEPFSNLAAAMETASVGQHAKIVLKVSAE